MSATLLRCEMLDGFKTKWRAKPDVTRRIGELAGCDDKRAHAVALCDVFGLDVHRVYFDLPSTFFGGGVMSSSVGGFVLERGTDRRIGKIVVATEGEKFRDVDPRDEREFDRL